MGRLRALPAVAVAAAALILAGCEPADEATAPEPDPPEPTPAEPTPAEPEEPTPPDADEPEPQPDEESGPELDAVSVTLTEIAVLGAPTAGSAGPDGRLWVADRAGTVHRIDDGAVSDPLLDLADETTTDGERGLLGLAFDEDHTHLYLSYTDPGGDSRVDAWRMEGGEPDPGTRRTVFALEQPYANHNGGDVAIGPDGLLWFGLGDGGGAGDPLEAGQDLGTPLGALLRVDPGTGGTDGYAVPDDNPFVDDPEAHDAIWAYGLRNPWRFSFDAETGDLWIADVGQSDREEVNVVPAGEGAGANFGWNLMEGTLEFAGPEPQDHWPPVYEYETTRGRCAITGGYVYRGEAIPALRGAYVFSDYCEGVVHALDVRDGELVAEADLGLDGGQVVAFAEGPGRELYVLDLGGAVWRLDPA